MIQFHRTITVHQKPWRLKSSQTGALAIQWNVICLVHNFKGYDSYFILEQCYRQYRRVNQLAKGAKILSLSFMGLKFLDSMSFLRLWLANC